ncbi:MAG: proton-conducting transporter membrane subunit, partial [Minisyncoccia bacterium]
MRGQSRTMLTSFALVVEASAALVAAVDVLSGGPPLTYTTRQFLPMTGVTFRLDALGALFVAVTAVVVIAAVIYLIGYAPHLHGGSSSWGAIGAFVTGMLLVPAAASVATFLVLWELMAIASVLLVAADHRRSAEARSAAQWYAVMTQCGAAFILLGLVVLASHSGGQNFSWIAAHAHRISPALRSTAFILTLIGFASKAGVVPLHVWLPRAHPEAPSPISALMSAAMVNLGIYGILRVGSTLLGGGPAWWWIIVLGLGGLSALYGAIHSATSTDLKKLLAYSTTDNMGLVLIGVGASGLLAANHHPSLAALALLASLLHLVNHAMFKGALFLSAGSIQQATGTRDLDQLGGLLRRMPISGAIFAVAALSIAALPPFNGFVSEWLLFQSLLHGLSASGTAPKIVMPVGVAVLALAGGLTAAAFVKAFGVGMLGQPRSVAAAEAVEPAIAMRVGAGLLASLCCLLGVAPILILPALSRSVGAARSEMSSIVIARGTEISMRDLNGVLDPALLAATLVVAMLLVAGARRRVAHRRMARRVEAWGCGRELQTARMEYTATSFGEPLQRVFDDIVRPDHDLAVTNAQESRYFVDSVSVHASDTDAFEHYLYRPVFAAIRAVGQAARRLQNGSVHRYLAYGLAFLVIILV